MGKNVKNLEGQPKYGQRVTFVDTLGHEHDALVTAVWGPQCVNLVYVNLLEGQTDTYGQKLLRVSSVVHKELQPAHGNYWYAA